MVKTNNGNTASMLAACEQDGINYHNPICFMRNYNLQDSPQAAFIYSKMDKNAKKLFRKNAIADAVKQLA